MRVCVFSLKFYNYFLINSYVYRLLTLCQDILLTVAPTHAHTFSL